jgi:hypothetical protein
MSQSTIATLLLIGGVIAVLLGVYYIIPGIYHPLTFHGKPTDSHLTHFIGFLAIGIVAIIGSRFVRNAARS